MDNGASTAMPIGGIGSGWIEMDASGRLRRFVPGAGYKGPTVQFSDHTFLALRVITARGLRYSRILQVDLDADSASAKRNAPGDIRRLLPGECSCHFMYPSVTFQLRDTTAPIRLTWTLFSPIIPYDHIASVLPAVLIGARITNLTKNPIEVSLLYSMENPTGTLDAACGTDPICKVRVEPNDDINDQIRASLFRGAVSEGTMELPQSYRCNSLLFGDRRLSPDARRDHYCLAASDGNNLKTHLTCWDPNIPRMANRLVHSFGESGHLLADSPGTRPSAAAICSMARLDKGASYRFDFVFAWYLGDTLCERLEVSNGYTAHFHDAPEAARHGLKHMAYFSKAIAHWHKLLSGQMLPPELGQLLANSAVPLTTLFRQSRNNAFILLSDPEQAPRLPERWDFFHMFAVLLFAPRFHSMALTERLRAAMLPHEEPYPPHFDTLLKESAELLLSMYAELSAMGNRARLQEWWPAIQALTGAFSAYVTTSGLLNEHGKLLSAEILGLWAAVIRAAETLATDFQNIQSAQGIVGLSQALRAQYEQKLRETPETAIIPALSGACCAELLRLAPLAPKRLVAELLQKARALPPLPAFSRFHTVQTILESRLGNAPLPWSGLLEELRRLQRAGDSNTAYAFSADTLNAWAVYHALAGVHYNALHQVLTLTPMPIEKSQGELPVFTSVTLGSARLEESPSENVYFQAQCQFDAPLSIAKINVQMRGQAPNAKTVCLHDTDAVPCAQEIRAESGYVSVVLNFPAALKLAYPLSLRIRNAAAADKP